jgi:hypothetical protein
MVGGAVMSAARIASSVSNSHVIISFWLLLCFRLSLKFYSWLASALL